MKQKDIAALILVTAVAMLFSWVVFNAVINTEQSRSTEVEVVNVIEGEFSEPDLTIFKEDYFNPTEEIKIGDNPSDQPFEN